MTMIVPLINSPDGFELIRDRIAEILAAETVSQQALASAEGYNSDCWRFTVYTEHSRPFEEFREGEKMIPIVNVWYDSDAFDRSTSNYEDRQATVSQFNIDCFAYSPSFQTTNGQVPGDKNAAEIAHRMGRIVRRILMHPKYEFLGFSEEENPVWYRWVSNRTAFQQRSGNQAIQNVMGFRLNLEVKHNEIIDIYQDGENIMEELNIQVYHEPGGLMRAELLYKDEV
jgi:hypothetical protein